MASHRLGTRRPLWATLAAGLTAGLVALMLHAPFAQAAPGDYGYPGLSYSGAGTAPTADKPQSKLWFNDGFWWADMFLPATPPAVGTWHIFKLNRATESWTDTDVQIDDRPSTRGDTLWDGTHLYVASNVLAASSAANVPGQSARLYRYSYASGTYTLDQGFPVNINNTSSESLTLDKDSRGVLWATWTQQQSVYVNSTNGTDSSWGAPIALSSVGSKFAGASGLSSDDISSVAAYGKNKIALMWSNQSTSTFYFVIHRDADPVGSWIVGANLSSPAIADDHINLKQLEGDDAGHLYAAVKTSLDSTGSQTAAQNMLLGLNVSTGAWQTAVFGTVADCHTRPMIVIDTTNKVLHMFATGPSSGTGCPGSGTPGTIYEKTTPLSTLAFPSGRGTPVIRDAAFAGMNNVTGTKQNVTAASRMVVLASNDDTSHYWHADISLGGSGGTAPVAGFNASATSGTAPLAVAFSDASTGGVTGWSWSFGDGTSSTAQNPSHTYTTAGSYTATLTVTAPGGTTSASKTITVGSQSSGSTIGVRGPSWSGGGAATTAIVLGKPNNTTAGDVLIASFTADNTPTKVTAPSGWSLVASRTTSGASVFSYYHVVTAADDATSTWTWTLNASQKWTGGMAAYTNVDTTHPLDGAARTASTISGSSISVTNLSTATAGAVLVGGIGADSGKVTANQPSSWTETWDTGTTLNGVGQTNESAWVATTAVGTQTSPRWTQSGLVALAAWAVPLRPKAA
jgi:PKD repeat protein